MDPAESGVRELAADIVKLVSTEEMVAACGGKVKMRSGGPSKEGMSKALAFITKLAFAKAAADDGDWDCPVGTWISLPSMTTPRCDQGSVALSFQKQRHRIC